VHVARAHRRHAGARPGAHPPRRSPVNPFLPPALSPLSLSFSVLRSDFPVA
jgi:hypothetical protein